MNQFIIKIKMVTNKYLSKHTHTKPIPVTNLYTSNLKEKKIQKSTKIDWVLRYDKSHRYFYLQNHLHLINLFEWRIMILLQALVSGSKHPRLEQTSEQLQFRTADVPPLWNDKKIVPTWKRPLFRCLALIIRIFSKDYGCRNIFSNTNGKYWPRTYKPKYTWAYIN